MRLKRVHPHPHSPPVLALPVRLPLTHSVAARQRTDLGYECTVNSNPSLPEGVRVRVRVRGRVSVSVRVRVRLRV